MPDPQNRFSTGQIGDRVRNADDVPDPDGQEGYEIIMRLANGEEPAAVASAMAMTVPQVEGLLPFVNTAANIKVGEAP